VLAAATQGVGACHARNGLPRPRRHLKDGVAPRVEGLLQVAHVSILFRIQPGVREQHREVFNIEQHVGDAIIASNLLYRLPAPVVALFGAPRERVAPMIEVR
jgi:hypothetical protein